MTRVLVTGASGFIGQHLVRALVGRGDQVTCLVRASSDKRPLEALGVRLAIGDIARPQTLEGPVREAEVVYHLASLLKMPWKREFHDVNVYGTANLAAACAAASSPPVLVLVSSLAAGGPTGDGRARIETDGASPVSIYGRVKLAAERAACAHAARVPITIVRPPMVMGEGDRSLFSMFRTAARGWHVVPFGGAQRLSWIHAADLSTALVAAGARGKRASAVDDPAGVYYVAGDHNPTWVELGQRVAASMGKRVRLLRLPSPLVWLAAAASELLARARDRQALLTLDKTREGAAGSWICDAAKARSELALPPSPSLDERLAQTAAWYRREGWLS